MSLHRRPPSMKILLPKSPKFQKSSHTPTRRLNFNIIQLDSQKNPKFSYKHSTHSSNSDIQSIVESFLNTRYSDAQPELIKNAEDTKMISRIVKITEQRSKCFSVSEVSSVHREKILKILSIVEEETLKYDENLEALKVKNFKLKQTLSNPTFKPAIPVPSTEEIIKLHITNPTTEDSSSNTKIASLKDLANITCKSTLNTKIEEILNTDHLNLTGAICTEIIKGRAWVGDKAKELELLKKQRLDLEAKLSMIEEEKQGVRVEIDLLELAETWTDVSYSDEYGRKS